MKLKSVRVSSVSRANDRFVRFVREVGAGSPEQIAAVGRGYGHVSSLRIGLGDAFPCVASSLASGAHSGRRLEEKVRHHGGRTGPALRDQRPRKYSRHRRFDWLEMRNILDAAAWGGRKRRTEAVPCLGSCRNRISHRDSMDVVGGSNEVNSFPRLAST